jgi:hypothetical protein
VKNIISLIVAAVMLTACGSDDKYTWGDAYQTIAEEFCHFASECNYFETEDDRQDWRRDCVDHSMFHECQIGDSVCDVSLADGAEETVDACVEAMHQPDYASDCDYVYFGVLPAECGPVWDLKPETEQ